MTSVTVPQTGSDALPSARRQQLRRMLTGGTVFDAAMGIFCLSAASEIGSWLSIPRSAVLATGGVFLGAALTGLVTVRRRRLDVRWIVLANAIFAIWCLVVLATDDPSALGVVLLVGATLTSAGTAVAEQRLATTG